MLPPDVQARLADIERRLDALGRSAAHWYREPAIRADEDGFDVIEVAIVADGLVRPKDIATGISEDAVAEFLIAAPIDVRYLLDVARTLATGRGTTVE